MTQSVQS